MTTSRRPRAPVAREKCVSAKVTEEEYATIEALAFASNQTVSGWARTALTTAAGHESPEQAVLAEMLALRHVLLNIHFAVGAGQPITHERMVGWIQEADADKSARARARLIEGS